MAKRKLTPKARLAVRREMKRMIGKKMKPSEILAVIAKKYPIGVESARWYLKHVTGGCYNPTRNWKRSLSTATRIPEVLQTYSATELRRALKATRILVPLRRALKKKKELERDLARATQKIDELTNKIHALVGRRGK